ncbi:MAG TPA: hypothetical protein VHN18_07215 [Micromonosporaceae bacterium]|nr:hypothetical protein [Micromonosporaceae bacterium]
MAIPEEDLGPGWLRDYGAIEADIQRMEQFAATLRAEVMKNYAPHLELVAQDMTAPIPQPKAGFAELVGFLTTHQVAQVNTTDAIFYHRDRTGNFATAASKISENYGASDAFAHARVSDVERALDTSAAVPAVSPGQSDPRAGGTTDGPIALDTSTNSAG